MSVLFVLAPIVLIAILYIIIKLKSQKIHCEHSINAGQQHQQKEQNVLKLSIAVMLGFVVCWFPSAVYSLLVSFASDVWSRGFQYFTTVARFMAQANVLVSWIAFRVIKPLEMMAFRLNSMENFGL